MITMTTTHAFPRIVSMVPSWTEMLLSIGVPVVGRTRFCIEPGDLVKSIPIVGGTKDWDISKLLALEPDLIILDKDENPKSMSEGHTIPFLVTHVRDIPTCITGIQIISQSLPNAAISFHNLIQRWQNIAAGPSLSLATNTINSDLPGLVEWIKRPLQPIKTIHYIIWKNPWMIATRSTFIGDIAQKVGLPLSAITETTPYPEINLSSLDPDSTLLLFSSEPYPFHKKTAELQELPFASAVVDGQSFSWFGTRSLQFLEGVFSKQPK